MTTTRFRRHNLGQCLTFVFGATVMAAAHATPPVASNFYPSSGNGPIAIGGNTLNMNFNQAVMAAAG